MTPPDYSTWLTKQQAAEHLGCSTKTVEQFAKDRKIEQAVWRRDGRGMPLAVYDPSDVARIAAERRGEALPFVLPAVGNGNGHGAGAIVRSTPAPLEPHDPRQAWTSGLAELAAALRAATSQSSESSQSSQRFEKIFLTLQEASAVSGLPQVDLRRLIQDGALPHRLTGRGGIRIRKKDLEAL